MNRADCEALDATDSLASIREQFQLPAGVIYLDGNSLGPLLTDVATRVADTVTVAWGEDLIRSWNKHDWIGLPRRVGEKIAPLIGAGAGQVICADSTSVNLFKLITCALELNPGRKVVLSEQGNFPTDLYMAQGIARLLGSESCVVESVPTEQLASSLDERVAVLMLTHVNFRTGGVHDMQSLTAAAHACGALVLWDLSHSAGALPLAVDNCDADLAVGCGYKFLNGGPGAPAFLYVASRHQGRVQQPLSGWMGHARPFDFEPDYDPAAGIDSFASGTPGILGLVALDAALDAWQGIDMHSVRNKSLALARLMCDRVQATPALKSLTRLGPNDESERGSQVSFSHPQAHAIVQALIERGVIGDFREPDIMRFGLCPLYLRHVDVFDAVTQLIEVVSTAAYRDPRFQSRALVT